MTFRRRRLPHWSPDDAAIFLTWRLHGTLPEPKPEWQRLPEGKRFAAEDRALASSTAPRFLANPKVAACVSKTIQYGADHLHLYDLHAWVVMPNHVHLLIDPKVPLSQVTHSVKTYSAREANQILNRSGQTFWAIEAYDHWVRSLREFESIIRYIEFNPVSAGLVANPEDWRWSSAMAGQRPALLKEEA